MTLTVLATGPRTTIQDLGRAGLADQGIPRSGAADRAALALANRLLGNDPGAAGLEATFGGLTVRTDAGGWFVVTGASVQVTVDGQPVGCASPFYARAGAVIALGAPHLGLRSYLVAHGGLATARLLGSRSEDTLSGIVPKAVTVGATLEVGEATGLLGHVDVAPVDARGGITRAGVTSGATRRLRVHVGPRRDWIDDASWRTLTTTDYAVSNDLDRIGVRFTGAQLNRVVTAELPSEGLIAGAVQLPPSGQPIVFLADHPTTGGYPVIAVVDAVDLPVLAQLTPGEGVRFVVH